MSHSLKKAAPKRISFVGAVTMFGDLWCLGIALLDVGTEERTHDTRELSLMKSYERGTMARVYESPLDEDAYPPIETSEHGFGYRAVREGYDGAPDSHHPIGIGYSKYAAISALLEQEWERAS